MFGIKICRKNVSVEDAEVKDLLIDTSYPLLKVKMAGSGTLSVSDGSGDVDTITHNLGYVPRVLVYGQTYDISTGLVNSGYTSYPFFEGFGGPILSWSYYSVSTTQLKIYGDFYDESGNSANLGYFYYIFYEEK